MTTRPVMSLCSVRIGTLNLCLANQKTTGPQAICHGAWSPPFFLLPGQPALLHCLMSDPVRPTWWLVSQSEDRGPPGKSVMAPGPPLLPLPGQPWFTWSGLTRPGRPGGWLANQKTAGPQAICHGAWSPPPASTWPALRVWILPGIPGCLA